ncbi:tetratricopeptide repeat protein [Effusibacillus consociatus]|uniref:Tetratricopeptide repeat protein n=1 Tax=Effusibacillus consociatus TaxID=1117041 RepID=A0ABV9Q4K4_9BACL
MISLGDKIQRLRVWRGITQTELASGLVTPSMISQIEGNKANPSTELLLQIIERLGVSVETFLKDVYLDLGGRALYRFAVDLMEFQQYGAALKFLKQLEERPNVVEPHELEYQVAICLQNTGKVQEAIEKLDEVLNAVQVGDDREFVAKVYYQLGDAYYKLHNLSLAVFYGQKADLVLEDLPEAERFLKARVKNLLGVANSRFGQYEKSVKYHQAAYEYYLPDHLSRAATMLMNLGIEYKNLGDYEKSKDYYEKSLEMFSKLPVEKNSIAAKYNYGVLLGVTAKYELALKMLEECLAEYQEHKYREMLPGVYSEMAQIEVHRGNLDKAAEYAQKGIESCDEEHHSRAYLYKVMAQISYQKKNYEEAIVFLERSIPIYHKYSRIADLVKVLPMLSKCYQELGDVEKAMSTMERSKVYMKNLL